MFNLFEWLKEHYAAREKKRQEEMLAQAKEASAQYEYELLRRQDEAERELAVVIAIAKHNAQVREEKEKKLIEDIANAVVEKLKPEEREMKEADKVTPAEFERACKLKLECDHCMVAVCVPHGMPGCPCYGPHKGKCRLCGFEL